MSFFASHSAREYDDRARAAEARADAEARRADRAAELAAHGPETMRELHLGVAKLHRRLEHRQRTSARIQRSLSHRLADASDRHDMGPLLAAMVADVFGAPSSAVLLVDLDGEPVLAQGSSELAALEQDLELVHAEGPLLWAATTGRPITLRGSELVEMWPGFGPAARELDVHALEAFPLTLAEHVIGAVGHLNPPATVRREEALDVVAETCAQLAVRSAFVGGPAEVDTLQAVHQAAGVVAATAGCAVADAAALIRAHAFAESRPLSDVAREVLSGQLRIAL